jgi:23S rRNA (pseudouridine1915-N3)-methyltransferase
VIRVLAVGKIRASYYREAVADYLTRAGRFSPVEIVEVPDSTPPEEGRALWAKAQGGPTVACDVAGRPWSTERLAEFLGQHGGPCFFVGGPDGLDADVLDRADHRLQLSAMTFPHELARLMLVEQIYRALTILRGHPYHR